MEPVLAERRPGGDKVHAFGGQVHGSGALSGYIIVTAGTGRDNLMSSQVSNAVKIALVSKAVHAGKEEGLPRQLESFSGMR